MPIGTPPQASARLAFALGLALTGLAASARADTGLRRMFAEEPHMGVLVRVDAYVPGTVNPAKAFRSAFERVSELARRLSTYRDDSEVREIERWAWQEAVPVSQEFALVLGHALRLAQASNGAFDPTVGPVTRLIRTHGRQREGPGPTAIQAAWGRAGWKHVELDERARTVFLRRRGVQFDFGGIAKGYIADEALRTLAREGISRAIVSVAGDIAVGDPPPDADGWRIALDRTGDRGTSEMELLLRNQAVSSSGSRERYYLADGEPCSHIVARSAGHCTDAAIAVSVVAPSGLEADGLATALVALGPAGAADLLVRRPRVRAYWSFGDPQTAKPDHQRSPSIASQR